MKKTDSTETIEQTYLSETSLLSESIVDNILSDNSDKINEPKISSVKTIKSKFTTPFNFKSFKNRNQKKAKLTTSQTEENLTSTSAIGTEKRKFRATLVKRFSLNHMKKTNKNNKNEIKYSVEGGQTSTTSTPGSIKRHTPEGETISLSESNLFERTYQVENCDINNKKSSSEQICIDNKKKLVILEKSNQLQVITITNDPTSKELLTRNDEKTIKFQKSIDTEQCGDKIENKKLNITDCNEDVWPIMRAPSVPYNISEVEISKLLVATGDPNKTHQISSGAYKGAIKKTVTTTTQEKTRREFFEKPKIIMNKSGRSLERGRRCPRSIGETEFYTSRLSNIDNNTNESINEAIQQPKSNIELIDNASNIKETKEDLIPSTSQPSPSPPPQQSSSSPNIIGELEPKIMANSVDKREHLYKILVIGELGTGKTSFIKRYVHQFFSQNYRATIGVDFALKVLNWDNNTTIRLQLWDIAGQERFGNMTRVYYKEAVGAFIVFDVTRTATFDAVIKWKQDLDSKVQLPNGNPIPCFLLANKCDQPKQGIVNTQQKLEEYVKENGFAGVFETSAKENINIEEAARALVNKILLNDKLISSEDFIDSDKFGLDSSHTTKKNCSC